MKVDVKISNKLCDDYGLKESMGNSRPIAAFSLSRSSALRDSVC